MSVASSRPPSSATDMSYQRYRKLCASLKSLRARAENGSTLARNIVSRRTVLLTFSLFLVFGSLGAFHHHRKHSFPLRSDYTPPFIPHPLGPVVSESRFPVESSPITLEDFRIEMRTRLESIGLPASKLDCRINEREEMIYDELRDKGNGARRKRILIALNLHSSEAIMQSLSSNLLTLADFLGEVTVSIYENNSTDHTPDALSHLATVLSYAKISHSIRTEREGTDWGDVTVHRIEQLAQFRNEALSPLFDPSFASIPFDTVLFINDIFFCPSDALELLSQQRINNADAVCGLDWIEGSLLRYFGFGTLKFYDNWVARSITGELVRSRSDTFTQFRDGFDELFPATQDVESRISFQKLEPVPVFSCWNGMIALDARPLLGIGRDGETLEKGRVRFRSAVGSIGECAASECQILASDYWKHGYKRWLMIPTVAVTYTESVYHHWSLQQLRTSRATSSRTLVNWSTADPGAVVCYRWQPGDHFPRTTELPRIP